MAELQRVLVVDASKLVRASLAKYLKGHFEVAEDVDGESAWQTLVLDSSIVAVISGCSLAVLDGIGLVERMRENRLCRLNRLPFFMLVSDSFSPAERQGAHLCGVSGFIPKGMAAAEINALLKRFVEQVPLAQNRRPDTGLSSLSVVGGGEDSEHGLIGTTDIMGAVGRLAGLPGAATDEAAPAGKERDFLDRQGIALRLKELLPGNLSANPVGLLVFGLDGYDVLVSRYGKELAQRFTQKISNMLADKIRLEDSIGYLAPGRIAIIAPQTDMALCSGFASRVCKALAAAQISLRGQRLGMSVSIGIAALPDDGASLSGQALLALAVARLDAAMRAGGNQVLSGCRDRTPVAASPQEFLVRLSELLASAPLDVVSTCPGSIGLQMLPLLSQVEQALQLGLPIDDLGRRLGELAQNEQFSV